MAIADGSRSANSPLPPNPDEDPDQRVIGAVHHVNVARAMLTSWGKLRCTAASVALSSRVKTAR